MTKSTDQKPSITAARIQERLDTLGKTARAVSLEIGCSEDFVRSILRGKSQSPRGANLMRLARELQTTPEYLTGEDNRIVRLVPANDDTPRPWAGLSLQDQLGGIDRWLRKIYYGLGFIAWILLFILWRVW